MGIWTDIASWRPTSNHGPSMLSHRGVVLHIAEGTFEGTVAWCQNTSARVSAHFVVATSGAVAQLVDTDTQSWCQSLGNADWLSIEHEGRGGDALTAAQIAADARILARAHAEYGIPLVPTDSTQGRGLGYHAMGGAAWGGHYSCPGDRIIAQRMEIIRAAEQLITTGATDMEMEDDMRSLLRYRDAPHVFLTDGLFARWVTTEGEIADLRQLGAEGTIRLGYGGQVRVVARRELVGRIIGRVPSGWEDLAA